MDSGGGGGEGAAEAGAGAPVKDAAAAVAAKAEAAKAAWFQAEAGEAEAAKASWLEAAERYPEWEVTAYIATDAYFTPLILILSIVGIPTYRRLGGAVQVEPMKPVLKLESA